MKQFNLIITCKFSDFAQAYVGLKSPEGCIAFIEEQDQMSFIDSLSCTDNGNGKFLTKPDLIAIWNSWVEVRIDSQMENGVYILNLTVTTPDVNNLYNGSIIECDCIEAELKELLLGIIKRNI